MGRKIQCISLNGLMRFSHVHTWRHSVCPERFTLTLSAFIFSAISSPAILPPFYIVHCSTPANKMSYVNFFYRNSVQNLHSFSVRRRFSRYRGPEPAPSGFSQGICCSCPPSPLSYENPNAGENSHFFKLKFVGNLKLFGSNLREHKAIQLVKRKET